MTRNDNNTKGNQMNATKIQLGQKISITTDTSGARLMTVYKAVRSNGKQYIYLATDKGIAAVAASGLSVGDAYLTGCYGIRKLETQYIYRLMARGLVTLAT